MLISNTYLACDWLTCKDEILYEFGVELRDRGYSEDSIAGAPIYFEESSLVNNIQEGYVKVMVEI